MSGPPVLSPGTVLAGRYQLNSVIAAGGMAQVWRARDKVLDRPVAIKILHGHLATDVAFVERFRREAVASARLSHSSIVAVYDTVSDNGVEAIVMELIDGRTLRTILDHTKVLPPSTVVQVGIQISDALSEAHRAGIVHRDIKPANIMIDNEMRVVVTDFGIAKATKDADLTSTGTLLGTAKYLAPEQVTGEPIDPRTDLYSLGVVLFEALTGEPPFNSETDAATALARIQGEAPHCRQRRGDVPVDLDAIVAKAMAREPDDRYERATLLKTALADANLSRPPDDLPAATVDAPPPAASTRNTVDNRPPLPTGVAPSVGAVAADSSQPVAPPVAVQSDGTAIMTPDMLHGQGAASPGADAAGQKGKGSRRERRRQAKRAAAPSKQRRWFGRTFLALLIVAGFVTAGLLALSGAIGGGDGGVSAGGLLTASGSTSIDPQGDLAEREDRVGRAIDQDARTAWVSETYRITPTFNDNKDGVGLVIFFDEQERFEEVTILTDTEDWSAEFYIVDDDMPDFTSWSQSDLDDFDPDSIGDKIGETKGANGDTRIDLDNTTGDTVLIWVTNTGQTVDSAGEVRNRLSIVEALFNGRELPEADS